MVSTQWRISQETDTQYREQTDKIIVKLQENKLQKETLQN